MNMPLGIKQYLNDSSRTWDKYTSEYETLSAVLVYNDTRTYINLDSYVRKDEERAQKVLNELIESLDKKNFNKNINADNPCIVLNYEKYKEFSYPRFIYSCFCFM